MNIAERFFATITKNAANLIELAYIDQIIQKTNVEQGSVTNSVRFVAITFYQPIVSIFRQAQ